MNYSNSVLTYITTQELLELLIETKNEQLLVDYIEIKLDKLKAELEEFYEAELEEAYQRGLDEG